MIDPATFRCQRCGACCRVPGYVALAAGEPEAIAAFLGLDVYAFTERYTTLTFNRKGLSLIEQENGHCVFLQDDNTCRIQPVKPAQCKGFPFLWRSKRLEKECPALAVGGDASPPCVPATGASCLLEAWRAADAWAVGRYVVMPDHVHLFCAPVTSAERPPAAAPGG